MDYSFDSNKDTVSVVGLGYVGLPLAVALSRKLRVIGYDNNEKKIERYKQGIDSTGEVGDEVLSNSAIEFTSNAERLKESRFIIVAVPTPVNSDHTPDLFPVESASRTVGRFLAKDTIVVFESTVYPGVTEDVCIPILETESGYKCGEDFCVGYSPERINPGDKIHRLEKIKKIVSGINKDTCDAIQKMYELIIDAGTYPVSSIRTAEAIKVVENSQRDINIAFMNELAMVFDKMGIDTNEVIDGMNTKWNALGFRPGLVGGHCIGVDPYYFTYEAEKLGYHSQIILNGRIVNDYMGKYIADIAIKKLVEEGLSPRQSRVVICGVSFKENCPDIRNTKVVDIIWRLNEYGVQPIVTDPIVDSTLFYEEYGMEMTDIDSVQDADCIILAVAHDFFKALSINEFIDKYYSKDKKKILIDVKGIYGIEELNSCGISWWRL